jgi:hypothetical protein
MKRIQALFLFTILFTLAAAGQSQIENPGFEQWDDIFVSDVDTIREPVNWSSLKTSDHPQLSQLAPVVCERSSDAHSGEYSVKLTNGVEIFGIVPNGVVTNGRVHADLDTELAYMYTDTLDDQWNTPFDARPDSIAGWFNYSPQGEDYLEVKVILHRGFGKQPDADSADNWVGLAKYSSDLDTGGEWIRFSAPFTYFSDNNPEYALVILNSGNGYQPVEGSIALFDDLEMIYNSTQTKPYSFKDPDGFIFAVDKQRLVIRGMDHTHFQTIRIFDITGKLVWTGTIRADQVDISSAHLENGLYLVNLYGKSKTFSQKIMLH